MKELIDKYLNGESSATEEQQLRQTLEQKPKLSKQEQALLMMLQAQPAEADADWLTEDESQTYERILHSRRTQIWKRWGMAAAVVAFAFAGLTFYMHQNHSDGMVAYVYGERITDHQEVLSMVEGTMEDMLSQSTDDEIENQLNDIFNH